MAIGVLLAQLGTPDAPTAPALKRYLREFLSDRRVVDYPRWFWLPILYGPILTFRPRKSAALYQRIWTEEGSPLLRNTQEQARLLAERLGSGSVVDMGMRYGRPSLDDAVGRLCDAGVDRLVVLPLFPQYSRTTTASVADALEASLSRRGLGGLPVSFIRSYASHPAYIEALAQTTREFAAEHGEPERWLLSFHGIPQRYVRRGDPYSRECEATAQALAQHMGWEQERWLLCYQSRFGPEPWLQPYTTESLQSMGAAGGGKLFALCPGFAADCLETLDEIGDVADEDYRAAGGAGLSLVPCLNAHPSWIEAMAQIVTDLPAPFDVVLSSL